MLTFFRFYLNYFTKNNRYNKNNSNSILLMPNLPRRLPTTLLAKAGSTRPYHTRVVARVAGPLIACGSVGSVVALARHGAGPDLPGNMRAAGQVRPNPELPIHGAQVQAAASAKLPHRAAETLARARRALPSLSNHSPGRR
jgi:hypothetical protein